MLDTALESGVFDKIIVSTDIQSIILGEFTPSVEVQCRPNELAQGGPNSIKAVVKYVLDQYDEKPDYFALLQPTSPFLRVKDIEMGCWQFLSPFIDSFQTLKRIKHHDHAYNQRRLDLGFYSEFVFPLRRKDVSKQSQPVHYGLGNLIMTRTDYFLQNDDFFGRSAGYEIPWKYCIDIDHEDDLELAELICPTL